jgi:hypothetical protein
VPGRGLSAPVPRGRRMAGVRPARVPEIVVTAPDPAEDHGHHGGFGDVHHGLVELFDHGTEVGRWLGPGEGTRVCPWASRCSRSWKSSATSSTRLLPSILRAASLTAVVVQHDGGRSHVVQRDAVQGTRRTGPGARESRLASGRRATEDRPSRRVFRACGGGVTRAGESESPCTYLPRVGRRTQGEVGGIALDVKRGGGSRIPVDGTPAPGPEGGGRGAGEAAGRGHRPSWVAPRVWTATPHLSRTARMGIGGTWCGTLVRGRFRPVRAGRGGRPRSGLLRRGDAEPCPTGCGRCWCVRRGCGGGIPLVRDRR